jgi:thiol-disulfide isomerase/thioredoxin
MKRVLALTLVSVSLLFLPLTVPQPSARPLGAQSVQQDEEITFRLRGVDGKTYDIANMKGNVLLVSFGATWCQPCVSELRALEELKKEYRDKPVKILWASIEDEDSASDGKLRDFAKSLKITFPVVRDGDRLTYAQFSTRARIPLVVFFDKQGNVVKPVHVGMSSPEMYKMKMRGILDKLLASNDTSNAVRKPEANGQQNPVTGQTRPRMVTRPFTENR